MKKYIIFIIISIIASSFYYCTASDTIPEKDRETIQKIVSETALSMQSGMMKEVLEQVNKNGYAKSVSYCSEFAPSGGKTLNEKLKAKFTSEYGIRNFKFRRTSLKYRNPKNAPDEFENKILTSWENQEKSGNKAASVTEAIREGYRILVPIRIPMKTCLGCHGTSESMDAEAKSIIDKIYPGDLAKGFNEGDLRGAISITIEK